MALEAVALGLAAKNRVVSFDGSGIVADRQGFVAEYVRADGAKIFKPSPVMFRSAAPSFEFNAVGVVLPEELIEFGRDFFSGATLDDAVQVQRNLIPFGSDGTITGTPLYGPKYTTFGSGAYMEYPAADIVAMSFFFVGRYSGDGTTLATLWSNRAADTTSYFNAATLLGLDITLSPTALAATLTTAKPTNSSMPAHSGSLTVANSSEFKVFHVGIGGDSMVLDDLTAGLSTTVAAPVQTYRFLKQALGARIGSNLQGGNQGRVDMAFAARMATLATAKQKTAFLSFANKILQNRGILS